MLAPAHRPVIRLATPVLVIALGLSFLAMGVRGHGEDTPSRAEAEKHLRAAEKAAQQRDFARTKEELAKCLQLGLDNAEVRLLAARTARRAGDYREAEKQLEACRRLNGAAKAIALEKVLLRAQRGEWMEAETALLLLAELKKDQPEGVLILEALARGYLESYCLREALTCLNGWLERQPEDTQALLWRAWVYEHTTARNVGEKWTKVVPGVMTYPNVPGVWEPMPEEISGNGEPNAKALDDYRRIMELDPELDVARLRLAEGLLASSQAEEALEHFQRLQKRHPKNAAVRLGLARCRILLGEVEEGRKLLEGLLADHPRNARALAERGRLLLLDGKPAEAEKSLRQALTLTPSDYQANYRLAQCLAVAGKADEAEKVTAKMQRIEKNSTRFGEILGKIQYAPRDAALRCEAGLFLLREGREAEGVRWLHTALLMDPRHRPSHQALADYYQRNGQKELAEKHRQQAR